MLLGKNYVYSLSPLVLCTDLSWRSIDFYMPGRWQQCLWKINQSVSILDTICTVASLSLAVYDV